MKQRKGRFFGTQGFTFCVIALVAVMGFVFTGCGDAEGGPTGTTSGDNGTTSGDSDPVAADYAIAGLAQAYDGQPKVVTVTPKAGKSSGAVTVYYEGIPPSAYTKSATAPSAEGEYKVTFDVAAASGWKAAAGLDGGTLVIGGDNNGGDNNNGGSGEFSISGKFTTNAGTSYFTARKSSGSAAASIHQSAGRAADDVSAVATSQVPLTGTLDDGDITFRLKGFYDEETDAYTLQAASSVIKYSISGKADGGATASVATRGSASEPFGAPVIVQVSTGIAGAELESGMTSTGEADLVEGFTRDDVWGVWYDDLNGASYGEFKYVVDEWGITQMYREAGEWKEGPLFGFSKIIENPDNSIDVIGTSTNILANAGNSNYYTEFLAELETQGFDLVAAQDIEIPHPEGIFATNSFVHEFDGISASGILASGTTGRYLVLIGYDWPEPQDGGTEEEPFVVNRIGVNGDTNWLVGSPEDEDPPIAAATLEGVLEEALEVIKTKTDDTTVTYQEIPWSYTTAGVLMSRDLRAWQDENPTPVSEQDGDYWARYYTVLQAKLLEYFPERFSNNLLVQASDDYNELYNQFVEKMQAAAEAGYISEFFKWKIVEESGKLILKMYSSDGTFNTAFVKSYAEAEAFTQFLADPFATLSR